MLKTDNFCFQGSPISSPVKVFCLPQAPDKHYNPERYNVTMSLPAEDLAILSDGSGAIYLLQTGNRQNNAQEWKVHSIKCLLF